MSKRRSRSNRQRGSSVSRRDFLGTAGLGAVGLATRGPGANEERDVDGVVAAGDRVPVELHINGRVVKVLAESRWSLVHVLREVLGLTGTKEACGRGECGSCTVLMGDEPRYACMTLAIEAQGAEITTIEGLLDGEELGAVQKAFVEHDGMQCGYCTPGQVMSVEGLLRQNDSPTLEEIRHAVSGNLCRCGAYPNIFRAAQDASGKRGGES